MEWDKNRIEERDENKKERKYLFICVTDPVSIKSIESGADEDFDAGRC